MKKYNKLIINNLKCSFRNNIFIYLLFVVLILLSCIYLKNGVMHGKSVVAGDYYFNIIKGVEKIDSNNKLKEIPFIYLGFAIFISYITGQILENECNKIFIIYAGTRKKWILSKITVIFINIVFMYMTAAIICFMFGKRKITFNSELFEKYFGTDYFIQNNENKFLYILVFFAAPIIASFAISMVQTVFSLAVKNMAGFIISMIIYIISIFDINIFLPGNGCMAQRSSLFMENGLSVSQVIIIDIIIIVITLIIQLKIISVKDIL